MTEHEESPAALLTVSSADGNLDLRTGLCGQDGRRSFPREEFGCQSCGAHGDDVLPVLTPAEGTVIDTVVVARHRGPGISAPFCIGSIDLGGGLTIRALVDEDVRHGVAVRGRLTTTAEGGEWVVFGPRKVSE
ncbi:hypothetical protein [Microbacterium suaedae]|uniref:hypothetical protein n=1 Tax=Microbacterium suaedae TaxID=2067813 RepID=UPI000DA13FF7|nr:hypothetical protein [Microbacterium suaedae]